MKMILMVICFLQTQLKKLPNNTIWVLDNTGSYDVFLGDWNWFPNTSPGDTGTSGGGGSPALGGPNFGIAKFTPSSGGNYWNEFSSTVGGLKSHFFAKSSDGSTDGGYIGFYYDETAWTNAFNGNSSDIIMSVDGSVYKDSISPHNLVINYNGDVGLLVLLQPLSILFMVLKVVLPKQKQERRQMNYGCLMVEQDLKLQMVH